MFAQAFLVFRAETQAAVEARARLQSTHFGPMAALLQTSLIPSSYCQAFVAADPYILNKLVLSHTITELTLP